MRGDRTRDQSIKSRTLYRTELARHWLYSKLGRVVKALALGASLERGAGSNPAACNFFWQGEKMIIILIKKIVHSAGFEPARTKSTGA